VQDDDIALIWLQDQSQTQAVADYLNANAGALFIDEVMAGAGLTLKFNSPSKDPATPDIIVQPIYGTVYTDQNRRMRNMADSALPIPTSGSSYPIRSSGGAR
jgi:hypothetical protein